MWSQILPDQDRLIRLSAPFLYLSPSDPTVLQLKEQLLVQASGEYQSKERAMNSPLSPQGLNIGFAGVVFTEQFQIKTLTPIFPFNVNFNIHETDMLLQAMRAFGACKLVLSELKIESITHNLPSINPL
jgi:hypothetical protein